MQASSRTVFGAPSLVRLLARVSSTDATEPERPLFERLSEWVSWTDAIALSQVLDAALPAQDTRAPSSSSHPAGAPARASGTSDEQLCAEARRLLARAIADDSVFPSTSPRSPSRGGAGSSGMQQARAADVSAVPPTASTRMLSSMAASLMQDALEYPVIRQHYVSLQQMMEVRIADLREQLRARLAARSPEMARLAALDETLERALGERERTLLGTVPALLGEHFKRLRAAEHDALSNAQDADDTATLTSAPTPGAWIDTFRKDMQSALHAELAIRFQPLDGLIAALRAR